MTKIKKVLPEESQLINDNQLAFYIEKLITNILAYCNCEDLPLALEYSIVDLVIKRIKDESSANENNVKSLEIGDMKLTFNTSNISAIGCMSDADFNSIKSQLNIFVKVKSL